MAEKKQEKKGREMEGIVVSNKMEKTVVVKVTSRETDRKYGKFITVSRKYKAHTEEEIAEGARVVIGETKPYSKDKTWKVLTVIS